MYTMNTAKLKTEVAKHIAADAVVQRAYWDGSKGCFIDCLAHSGDASELERLYGLPEPLVLICEGIFETLPIGEAKAFFADFPDAVDRDGKDLSRVHWAFLAAELRALPKVSDDIQAVIDPVIAGMELLAAGEPWDDALDASRAALYAARATLSALSADAADAAADPVAARGTPCSTLFAQRDERQQAPWLGPGVDRRFGMTCDVIEKTEIQLKGWIYAVTADSGHPFHYAVSATTGERKSIDHSGWEAMDEYAFYAHVLLGFPPRPDNVPWRKRTIRSAARHLIISALESAS